jgi:hypothetical protein
MPLDQTPIGALAASLMDEIEQATGDDGTIGAVCLIVEANTPDGQSRVFTKFNESRIHIRLGMLELARIVTAQELGGA